MDIVPFASEDKGPHDTSGDVTNTSSSPPGEPNSRETDTKESSEHSNKHTPTSSPAPEPTAEKTPLTIFPENIVAYATKVLPGIILRNIERSEGSVNEEEVTRVVKAHIPNWITMLQRGGEQLRQGEVDEVGSERSAGDKTPPTPTKALSATISEEMRPPSPPPRTPSPPLSSVADASTPKPLHNERTAQSDAQAMLSPKVLGKRPVSRSASPAGNSSLRTGKRARPDDMEVDEEHEEGPPHPPMALDEDRLRPATPESPLRERTPTDDVSSLAGGPSRESVARTPPHEPHSPEGSLPDSYHKPPRPPPGEYQGASLDYGTPLGPRRALVPAESVGDDLRAAQRTLDNAWDGESQQRSVNAMRRSPERANVARAYLAIPRPPEPPRASVLKVPGLWGVKEGTAVTQVHSFEFDTDEHFMSLAARWTGCADADVDLTAERAVVRLHCVPSEDVRLLITEGNKSPQDLLTALCSLKHEWPPSGRIIVEINPATSAGRRWISWNNALSPTVPPLDLTPHLVLGKNIVRIAQFGDVSSFVFILPVTQPAPDARELALKSIRSHGYGTFGADSALRARLIPDFEDMKDLPPLLRGGIGSLSIKLDQHA